MGEMNPFNLSRKTRNVMLFVLLFRFFLIELITTFTKESWVVVLLLLVFSFLGLYACYLALLERKKMGVSMAVMYISAILIQISIDMYRFFA